MSTQRRMSPDGFGVTTIGLHQVVGPSTGSMMSWAMRSSPSPALLSYCRHSKAVRSILAANVRFPVSHQTTHNLIWFSPSQGELNKIAKTQNSAKFKVQTLQQEQNDQVAGKTRESINLMLVFIYRTSSQPQTLKSPNSATHTKLHNNGSADYSIR